MNEHYKEKARQVAASASGVASIVGLAFGAPWLSLLAAGTTTLSTFVLTENSSNELRKEFLRAVEDQVLNEIVPRIDRVEKIAHEANWKADDAQRSAERNEQIARKADWKAEDAQRSGERANNRLDELSERLKAGGAPATELLVVLDAAYKAWTKSDDEEKRTFVLRGVKNSFFSDDFDRGLRTTLLDILSNLKTFEIHYLEALAGCRKDLDVDYFGPVAHTGKFHARHGLPGSLFDYAVRRLIESHLVRQDRITMRLDGKTSNTSSRIYMVMPLGQKLLKFIGSLQPNEAVYIF